MWACGEAGKGEVHRRWLEKGMGKKEARKPKK